MAAINDRRTQKGHLGFVGGLTQIKMSDSFKPPAWVVATEPTRTDTGTTWSAKVSATTTEAPEHDSWYAEKGLHERPGMATEKGGTTCPRYWDITSDIAGTIKRGEQEHLNDAALAFSMTYERIAAAINELAQKPIGPAPSQDEAKTMALRQLEQRIPKEVGCDPKAWAAKLDTLLAASTLRDTNRWHFLYGGVPYSKGCSTVDPVEMGPDFAVDVHKSDEVITYKLLAP